MHACAAVVSLAGAVMVGTNFQKAAHIAMAMELTAIKALV